MALMDNKYRRLNRITIALNLFLMAVFLFAILMMYLEAGKFQWVDPEAVADDEEIYLMPICVTLLGLGILTLIYIFPDGDTKSRKQLHRRFST